MLKKGDVSTEADTGPFLFTLAALLCCGTGAALLFVLAKGNALAVFAGILLSIVAAAAAAVLFAIVTDRAYVSDGKLFMSYLFKKSSVSLKDIGKIKYKEDVYYVYDKRGDLRGTINAKLTGIDRLLVEFDKKGVSFE